MATSTRLHITPLTRDLLPSVLPASIQPSASAVSFHTLPTFPESSYGYVTLPTMEAEKFRKKMDGSMLKGKKFRVEVARPQKRPTDESADDPRPVSGKSSKRQKREEGVLGGYELTDRQVKRGWTVSAGAKKGKRKDEKRKGREERKTKAQPNSKYTDKSECLFRTRVPPNRLSAADADEKQAKKKKKHSKESVVHEFSKTATHPTFVRSRAEGASLSATFEEGKGWMDNSGNLKEPVSGRIRSDQFTPGQVPGVKEKGKSPRTPSGEKSESQELKGRSLTSTKGSVSEPEDESDDWTSSSGETSSDDDAESDGNRSSSSEESVSSSSNAESQKSDSSCWNAKPTASTGAGREDRKQSSLDVTGEHPSASVHPLEALYKRSAPDSTEYKPSSKTDTQFSFFGNSDIESEDEGGKSEGPYTPFTKRDMEERGLRSGAPTPDTGLPPRCVQLNESEDEDNDSYSSTPVPKPGSAVKREESDFAKWFWENRGDNNRAWKKRRRDAAKEERQRENRRKGMKGKS